MACAARTAHRARFLGRQPARFEKIIEEFVRLREKFWKVLLTRIALRFTGFEAKKWEWFGVRGKAMLRLRGSGVNVPVRIEGSVTKEKKVYFRNFDAGFSYGSGARAA